VRGCFTSDDALIGTDRGSSPGDGVRISCDCRGRSRGRLRGLWRGSGLGPHALGNEVETVRSLAAEGALVAGQVAGGCRRIYRISGDRGLG